jgi:hypothetical protein
MCFLLLVPRQAPGLGALLRCNLTRWPNYDNVILSGDALRSLEHVCPLRKAAEKARAAARAAAALLEGDGRSTSSSSSMSSSDPGAGSAASDVTAGSSSEP